MSLLPGRAGPELLHLLRELPYYLGKPGAFRGRNPFQAKALFFDAEIRKHQANRFCTFFGFEIAFLVVTVSGMAAAHEDAIRPLSERLNDQVGMHHARAHDAYDANTRRVLAAGHARQVRACIGAPVATQRDNQRFEGIVHYATPNAAWICASI